MPEIQSLAYVTCRRGGVKAGRAGITSALAALAALAVLVPAVPVAAQTDATVELQQYQPTPFAHRLLRLDGAAVLPLGQYRVGVDADYARGPLAVRETAPVILPGNADPDYDLVAHAAGAALHASFGLGHRLEAAVVVPLTLFQTGESAPGAAEPSLAGVGNVRLGVKAHLGSWRGLGAGAAVLLVVPGGVGTLTHDPGVGGEGRLFCELGRGPIEAGLRVGFRLRRETTLYDVRLGSAIGFAIGLGVRLAARTAAFAEVAGSTAARRPFGRSTESPVEALVGVRQRFGRAWLTLAAGPGLSDGFGSPVFRGVLGLDWASRPPDSDDARPPPAATGSEIARP